jgi:hypothetical protein
MTMRWLLALWLALVPLSGWAQFSPPAMLSGVPVPASGYTGEGDIVLGATVWVGLRAYNVAYATGSNNAIKYRRTSDNTTQNGVILTNGKFDIASANTFAGPDGGTGVCTGSTSGSSTTLTISTCSTSATLHQYDTLTCSSCSQPVFIASVGTFSGTGSGASGTVILNIAQNITSQSITSQFGLFVAEAYDQTGNGNNLLQATTSAQPQLLPSCLNGLPCMFFLRSATQFLSTSTTITGSQPNISFSTVVQRLPPLASFMSVFGVGSQVEMYGASATNELLMYAGTGAGVVVTDSAFHSLQGVYNGGSSVFNIDGTDNTLSVGTNGYSSQTLYLGNDATTDPWGGDITEFGLWPDQFSSGNRTSLCHNQYAFWGTATSC